jgi:hypothetical protein
MGKSLSLSPVWPCRAEQQWTETHEELFRSKLQTFPPQPFVQLILSPGILGSKLL